MQIRPDHPTKQAKRIDGYELAREIRPPLPEWSTDPFSGEMAERTRKLLEIRSAVIDREYNIRKNKGILRRHQAAVEQCDEKLRQEGLAHWQIRDLEGRKEVSLAKIEYIQVKSKQWRLEIKLFESLLIEG